VFKQIFLIMRKFVSRAIFYPDFFNS